MVSLWEETCTVSSHELRELEQVGSKHAGQSLSLSKAKGEDLPPGFSKGLMNNVVKLLALPRTVVDFHSRALLLAGILLDP